jgi:mxaL protein
MTLAQDRALWLRLAALSLLLVTFALRPVSMMRPIYDAVVVMDITGSMNVRDERLDGAVATRLAMEKAATRALLAALPCGSRLALAIFVETRPMLLLEPVEVCDNFSVLDAEIAAIDWKMGWDSESHVAAALAAAMRMAAPLNADLIFMTDGQEEPPLAWFAPPDFARLPGLTHGLVVGVGGYAFSPIPRFDRQGREIGVWRPGDVPLETGGLFRGREHLSAVDEPHLRDLAQRTGLAYLHLEDTQALLPALARVVPRRERPSTLDVRFLPASLALVLLAASV